MAEVRLQVPEEFESAPVEERIRFVQELWERIAERQAEIPLSGAERELLGRRLEEHRKNPEEVVPWEQVRDELRSKLRDG